MIDEKFYKEEKKRRDAYYKKVFDTLDRIDTSLKRLESTVKFTQGLAKYQAAKKKKKK